jgi:prephenate dehydrogenase
MGHHPESVGVIGYGRMGRLLAELLERDFTVRIYDRDPARLGGRSDAVTLAAAAGADAVILAVPVRELPGVLEAAAPHVRPGAVVMDTGAVKVVPARLLRRLPAGVAALPMHPLFGPSSLAGPPAGQTVVLCPGRRTPSAVARFWEAYWTGRGFRVVRTTPSAHDRVMARSLVLTQWLGRACLGLSAGEPPFAAPSWKHLRALMATAAGDDWLTFADLQACNPYARAERRRLRREMARLERALRDVPLIG